VAWLLQQGANVNEEDAQGETALSRAVEKGPLNVMTLLFDAGADVTRGTPLRAALLRKAGKETINLMQEMLARGAPVDKFFGETSPMVQNIGFNQLTALHIACGRSYRNYEAVRLLLAHGANPALNQLNQPLYAGEAPNTSALEEARRVGNDDIVSLITAHMREVNGSSKSNL
jgi:ankyrin repeat protein